MPTIDYWIKAASKKLAKVGIKSSNLDAEIILSESLKKDRSYLRAYPDKTLPIIDLMVANWLLSRRQKKLPIAYLFKRKEFFGRSFHVNKSTLIPRPETETLIEVVSSILQHDKNLKSVIDIGTGSGCIGITCKLENPKISITLSDISKQALKIAEKNAAKYKIKPVLIQSNLLKNIRSNFDIIIANLPYVDSSWQVSPELKHEPKNALYAKDNGLEYIKKLLDQTSNNLSNNGYVIIEADPTQHKSIINYAKQHNLIFEKSIDFCLVFKASSRHH